MNGTPINGTPLNGIPIENGTPFENGTPLGKHSLREVARKLHFNREYVKALCDYGIVECNIKNGSKIPRYNITDKGLITLCMIRMEQDEKKRNGKGGKPPLP
jgi:hypothetical protein